MLGEVIGNFKITTRLGRGGMGEVFLAEQQKIGTKVAIKLLNPQFSGDKQHVDRFFNEALAVNKIKHAGIVKIFDVGFHEKAGSAYLIMEFLEGESLAGRIHRIGRLPLAQICDVGRQIASILEATHGEGITHRDLKPDNVFLVRDSELASRERVKILDFGIAKLTGTLAGAAPKTMGTMGTPGYMAPEQWGDAAKVTWRADVYSLGCLAHEMAVGQVPFLATTFAEAYVKHLQEPPLPIRSIVPELPESLEQLVLHMLAKKPEDRPASMSDIATRFEVAGRGAPSARITVQEFVEPVTPSRPAATPVPLAPTPVAVASTTLGASVGEAAASEAKGLRVMLYGGLAVVAVGIGGAGIYAATRGDPKQTEPIAQPDKPPPAPDAAPTVPEKLSLRDRIERENPFVTANGVEVQSHQVTTAEYKLYLESHDKAAMPLDPSWEQNAPGDPINWLTWEVAGGFCAAIGAQLPSDEQWQRVAGNEWGLDPAKRGVIGPLEEWTATLRDGFAIVRGGHAAMNAGDKSLAIESPMLKATRATAGDNPQPTTVASAVIGFRCAR